MSDVLSPAEQARAHRLSAQALYERNPTGFQASRYALCEIADHLDPPTPPETVESLRAERDAALAELAQRPSEGAVRILRASIEAIRDERDSARQMCREARGERDRANAAVRNLIKERNDEEARADAANAEAARGRCARED